nr:hypothetical protein GCM10020092_078700 [Actinoplanes digitatis]
MRAGRNRRRELLARMEAAPLVRALPLWIGTVADVEDLLPPEPGLFDLVVIDEASHVDQIRAAPVLARARRALIVGDPRQLRFVSFVSDVDVTQVLEAHDCDERLDVRRVSTYDLATSAAPVTWLAEHHRSVPHLIDFPARRFYGGRVSVMTRTPLADATDAIDVLHIPDATLVKGVNKAEVAAALATVERLAAARPPGDRGDQPVPRTGRGPGGGPAQGVARGAHRGAAAAGRHGARVPGQRGGRGGGLPGPARRGLTEPSPLRHRPAAVQRHGHPGPPQAGRAHLPDWPARSPRRLSAARRSAA